MKFPQNQLIQTGSLFKNYLIIPIYSKVTFFLLSTHTNQWTIIVGKIWYLVNTFLISYQNFFTVSLQ